MSIVKLRKMAMGSVMKFGKYPDLSVMELINLQRHGYLLWIYYSMSNIDFTEEVKEYLQLTPDREIEKPGKIEVAVAAKLRGLALFDIIERDGTYKEGNPEKYTALHLGKWERKTGIVANCIRQNKEKSKIHNRNRNQYR
jgi:hypothetical protein